MEPRKDLCRFISEHYGKDLAEQRRLCADLKQIYEEHSTQMKIEMKKPSRRGKRHWEYVSNWHAFVVSNQTSSWEREELRAKLWVRRFMGRRFGIYLFLDLAERFNYNEEEIEAAVSGEECRLHQETTCFCVEFSCKGGKERRIFDYKPLIV